MMASRIRGYLAAKLGDGSREPDIGCSLYGAICGDRGNGLAVDLKYDVCGRPKNAIVVIVLRKIVGEFAVKSDGMHFVVLFRIPVIIVVKRQANIVRVVHL